jgi:hypothetical protein
MQLRTLMLAAGLVTVACGDGGSPGLPPRTFLMGFSAIPPRFDSSTATVIAAINNWVPHADAAIMHVSPPWAAMLAGHTPAGAVDTVELPLAQYYRSKGLDIVFTVDATDGLNRAAEAPELVAAGRSITDTSMVQRLYREWTYAAAVKIQPTYLGLAAETNHRRAPGSVYRALVTMTTPSPRKSPAASLPSKLYVSVQVETAWGRLPPDPTSASRRISSISFAQALGLSSYPYLAGFAVPEVAAARLLQPHCARVGAPVLAVEGGGRRLHRYAGRVARRAGALHWQAGIVAGQRAGDGRVSADLLRSRSK